MPLVIVIRGSYKDSMLRIFLIGILFSSHAFAVRYGTKSYNNLVAHIKVGDATCTGVRVHRDYIMSAGHCFRNKSTSKYTVVYMDGTIKITAKKFISGVIIKGQSLGEELALIPLISINDDFVAPDFYLDQTLLPGMYDIYGYGMDYNGNIGTQRTGKVEFKKTYQYDGHKMLVVKPGKQNQNACPGDSGGPLFRTIDGKETLVGIVSFINHSERRLVSRGRDEAKLQACQIANQAFYVLLREHQEFINQHLN